MNGRDVAYWHECDLRAAPTNVRSWESNGLNTDVAFGPFMTPSGRGSADVILQSRQGGPAWSAAFRASFICPICIIRFFLAGALLAIRANVSTDGRTAFRAFLISSYA